MLDHERAREAQRLGLTILFISHDLPVVFRIADRVLFMHEGQIVDEAHDLRRFAERDLRLLQNLGRNVLGIADDNSTGVNETEAAAAAYDKAMADARGQASDHMRQIQADVNKMAGYGVTFAQIQSALTRENVNTPIGTATLGTQRMR